MSETESHAARPFSARRLLGLYAVTLVLLFAAGCWNPFAPGLEEGDGDGLLGDPSTIEGFFTRFQNAYQLRDTTLYGPLIARDFVFTFRDYDNNVDISWGRNEEMSSTYRLFINSQDIRIRWNNILSQDINEDRTRSQVIRRFDLTVALEASDLIRTDGAVNFVLERPDSTENWQLRSWRDESDL
ncbi:hypothetical protein CYPRO_0883 [Cyclonatronum proteinivorum]|uniref:Uncharacterized protein n=1 Tax=Cyclonatronum proteinivorum TaxID=1457365 RepID=A0A345UI58_9BACT|nr:hypothetical protein [Cyclonatronum proteinivorum]AXJ00160.1 hypothetical protein CYPRO_0883 [Cyclonatronum proteinivorum]